MRTTGLWMALVGVLCLAGTASGLVVYKDVGDLTVESRQIVIGNVVKIASFWDDDHQLIKSRIVIRIDDYLLGEGTGVEVLEMDGGTVGDLTLLVSVLPVFEVGDHVLLFLGDSEIRLVQSFQGAYLTDGEQVVRMAPPCRRVDEGSVQPVKDFLEEIERALPEGVTLAPMSAYQGDFVLPLGGSRYGLCGYDWTYKTNPMGEDIRINANCADASAGDADSQRTQIQNGMAAWNNAGADFAFTYGGTSTQTDVSYNGTNLIYFDTTPPDGGGYIAANFHWVSGGNMLESDIVLNDQYGWWNGEGSCSYMFDIWNIATHELGHTLCLADLYGGGDSQKTMYGYGAYCQTYARTLHLDDVNGIIAIYGAAGCTDPTANAGSDKALCAGNTVVLEGSASGGSGGSCPGDYSPSWSGPGIVSGGNTFNPTVDATGTYTLTVWCDTCQDSDNTVVSAAALGDWDGNGNVDLSDYDMFESCLSGPDGGLAQPECACGDFNEDDDVDLGDYAEFQEAYTG